MITPPIGAADSLPSLERRRAGCGWAWACAGPEFLRAGAAPSLDGRRAAAASVEAGGTAEAVGGVVPVEGGPVCRGAGVGAAAPTAAEAGADLRSAADGAEGAGAGTGTGALPAAAVAAPPSAGFTNIESSVTPLPDINGT